MLLVFLVSSPGAAVPAVSEDAHHGRRPDPRSRLQSSGRTLSQLRHQTDHQQAAALHQQPHSAGAHRCIICVKDILMHLWQNNRLKFRVAGQW